MLKNKKQCVNFDQDSLCPTLSPLSSNLRMLSLKVFAISIKKKKKKLALERQSNP